MRGTTRHEEPHHAQGGWRRLRANRAWSPGDVVDVAQAMNSSRPLQNGEQAAPKKFETMMPSMFGTTWAKTMCERLSPVTEPPGRRPVPEAIAVTGALSPQASR